MHQRILISILSLFCSLVFGQGFTFKNPEYLASLKTPAATGGGGCAVSIAQGDVTNETFASSFGAWSSNNTTITINTALSGSPPCQLPATGMEAIWSGANKPYAYLDSGTSTGNPRWYRFYFNLKVSDMSSSGNFFKIFGVDEHLGSLGESVSLVVSNNGSSYRIYQVNSSGGTTWADIATNTWHLAEILYQANATTNAFRLYNAETDSLIASNNFTSGNVFQRYVMAGPGIANNSASATVQITGFGMATTNWIGK